VGPILAVRRRRQEWCSFH